MAVGTGTNPADLLETDVCSEEFNEQFMSRTVGEEDGDVELCFDARITSVPAAFRPKGIFTATDQLGGALPAGSQVSATIYMQSSEPTVASLEGVLKATDREVGRSAADAATGQPRRAGRRSSWTSPPSASWRPASS